MRNAVAIASACGLPIAITSTISYMVLGLKAPHLPEWSLGYVYLPAFFGVGLGSIFTAPIGAKLAHKLPAQQLKRYFSVLIFIMGRQADVVLTDKIGNPLYLLNDKILCPFLKLLSTKPG